MKHRKISYSKYFFAALLAFLVFFLGLSLGVILTNERLMWLEVESRQQQVDYQSLQFQQLYLLTLENNSDICLVLDKALENSLKDLSISLDRFVNYNSQGKIKKAEFELVGRKYMIDNLRYFLTVEKSKMICNLDIVTVLYFFSEKDCPSCPNQGVVLTYFKKLFEDRLLIFPINIDFSELEPSIDMVRTRYNVTSLPTLVIAENKYDGILSREELGNIICAQFKNQDDKCKKFK